MKCCRILTRKNSIRYAGRNFFTSACVAVVWRIPLPDSSPSFEVSAIFLSVKLVTFVFMVIAQSMTSRKCNILFSMIAPYKYSYLLTCFHKSVTVKCPQDHSLVDALAS